MTQQSAQHARGSRLLKRCWGARIAAGVRSLPRAPIVVKAVEEYSGTRPVLLPVVAGWLPRRRFLYQPSSRKARPNTALPGAGVPRGRTRPSLAIAIAQKRRPPRVSAFRRLAVSAFVEGWALYTERLADERRLYEGLALRRRQPPGLAACPAGRHTGMHHRWSRGCVDFFFDNVGLSERGRSTRSTAHRRPAQAWPTRSVSAKSVPRRAEQHHFDLPPSRRPLAHAAVPLSTLPPGQPEAVPQPVVILNEQAPIPCGIRGDRRDPTFGGTRSSRRPHHQALRRIEPCQGASRAIQTAGPLPSSS